MLTSSVATCVCFVTLIICSCVNRETVFQRHGIKYPNYDSFFERALKFCSENFHNPVYIVASDDVPRMETLFKRLQVADVYFSSKCCDFITT